MGLYKNRWGDIVEVDDAVAAANEYTPYTSDELYQQLSKEGKQEAKDRDLGGLSATLSGLASGATLGLSDMVLASGLTDTEREGLVGDIESNKGFRVGGEIVGAIGSALIAPVPGAGTASTPAGILSQQTAKMANAGRAVGGARGTASVVGAAGIEGAVQNAGQYIGYAALEDREVTAEGMSGALGTGFLFGSIGGGAALGIEKGAISTRRLWSRYMDATDEAVKDAASQFENKTAELVDANRQTADVAKRELDELRAARQAAELEQEQAKLVLANEKMRAARMKADAVPTGVVDEVAQVADEAAPVPPLGDDVLDSMLGGQSFAAGQVATPAKRVNVPRPVDGEIAPTTDPFAPTQSLPGDDAIEAIGRDFVNAPVVKPKTRNPPSGPRGGNLEPTADDDLLAALQGTDAGLKGGETLGSLTGKAPTKAATAAATKADDVAIAWKPAGKGAYTAESPAGMYKIDGNNAGRNRWTVTYPDGDVGMVDSLREAKAWAEEHARQALTKVANKPSAPASVPKYADFKNVDDEIVTTMKARDLFEYGYQQPKAASPYSARDKVKYGKAQKAIAEGQTTPIEVYVSPKGRLEIGDGRNRLAAAVEADADIQIRFTRGAKGIDYKNKKFRENMEVLGGSDARKALPAVAKESVGVAEEAAGVVDDVQLAAKPHPIGDDFAKREAELEEALAEFEAAQADFKKRVLGMTDEIAGDATSPLAQRMPWRDADATVPTEFGRRQPGTMAPAREGVSGEDIGRVQAGWDKDEILQARARDAENTARFRSQDEISTRVTKVGVQPNAYDEQMESLLKRMKSGTDDEVEAAAREMDQLESAAPRNFVEEVAEKAEVIERYEKATAKLAEATGDAAHPMTIEMMDAYKKANDEAMRKLMDRTMRAAEGLDQYGPVNAGPKDRIASAKARVAELDVDVKAAKLRERPAQEAYDVAAKNLKESEKAAKLEQQLASKAAKDAAAPNARGGAADLGSAIEIMDIPGLPKPSDLPVVGPILGAWLKYRAVKAALGRFSGRVPATGNAKAAALAAQTKDKIARSVDRALGLVERRAAKAAQPAAIAGAALSRRIFDDGEEDAPKDAPIGEVAAVRIRELSAYVTTPGAIERDVRREMRDVSDPDLIEAAVKHRRMMLEHLLSKAPKMPDPDPLNRTKWTVPPAEAVAFGRRVDALNNPAGVFEGVATGQVSLEAAETLRAAFPRLFQLGQAHMLMKLGKLEGPVPYRTRVVMSMLFDQPLDTSLDPRNIRILQSAYVPVAPTPPQQAGVPSPSLAGSVSLNTLYQTGLDRSATRR